MAFARPIGAGASLRALGRTVAAILRTRIELLAVEGAQWRQRLGHLALLAVAGLLALLVGVQLLAGLAVAFYWDTPHRLQAIAILAALFAAVAVGCLLAIVRAVRRAPPALDGTLRSLAADLEAAA